MWERRFKAYCTRCSKRKELLASCMLVMKCTSCKILKHVAACRTCGHKSTHVGNADSTSRVLPRPIAMQTWRRQFLLHATDARTDVSALNMSPWHPQHRRQFLASASPQQSCSACRIIPEQDPLTHVSIARAECKPCQTPRSAAPASGPSLLNGSHHHGGLAGLALWAVVELRLAALAADAAPQASSDDAQHAGGPAKSSDVDHQESQGIACRGQGVPVCLRALDLAWTKVFADVLDEGSAGAHGTQEGDDQGGESQNDGDGGNDLRSSSCDFMSLCFVSAPTALNAAQTN